VSRTDRIGLGAARFLNRLLWMLNVIVTGASRGIGLGIATGLANDGYRVHAIARSKTVGLRSAIAEVSAGGVGEILFTPFDLLMTREIPGLVRGLVANSGSIYGLVNNAGLGTEGILASMSIDAMETLMKLNTLAPMVLAKHAVRSMMAAGAGRIVNMASIVATTGYSGLSVYSATKASMLGFTRSLAREVGSEGITVNAVAPGFIATDMTTGTNTSHLDTIARRSSLKRLAEIEDVVNVVTFLMGDKARNITCTVVTVDAGATA
jgi:3-oxoacyl-[acyl-carrier protein] reductase